MPLKEAPPYQPPFLLRQKDLNTIVPTLTRKVKLLSYRRTRLELSDGDFIDLDFSAANTRSPQIVAVFHGLEGCSDSAYIRGTCQALNQIGWDTVAVNFRSCSGEPNRLYTAYHSGLTSDIHEVVLHLSEVLSYPKIFLAGYSLGGSLCLKYTGEQGSNLPPSVQSVVGVSVPCDLTASCKNLQRRRNYFYRRRFLRTLRKKVLYKLEAFPEKATFSAPDVKNASDFFAFDNLYTAPAHGFKDAHDYYHTCSSKHFLAGIKTPTLLINALDDPFLTPECYPYETAREHPYLHFMTPKHGGHVGFANNWRLKGNSWAEDRIIEFFQQQENSQQPHS